MGGAYVSRGFSCGLVIVVVGLGICACAQPQLKPPDVEYVPTPHRVVAEMLRLAEVQPTDIVYDLGCGDGRVVIAAAKLYGTRGVGIDIDPQRIQESRASARQAGVVERVSFRQQDLFETDIRAATVVTLYLLPQLNRQLRPKLFNDLRPGTRVLSHDFDMGDWQPDREVHVPESDYEHTIFYWVIPAKVEGPWRLVVSTPAGERRYRMQLQQRYQEVRGTVMADGESALITHASLAGDRLHFTLLTRLRGADVSMSFDGQVSGNNMQGEVEVAGGAMTGRYDWTAEADVASRTLPIAR